MAPYGWHNTFTYFVEWCIDGAKNHFCFITITMFTGDALSNMPCPFCESFPACCLCSVIFYRFFATFVLKYVPLISTIYINPFKKKRTKKHFHIYEFIKELVDQSSTNF